MKAGGRLALAILMWMAVLASPGLARSDDGAADLAGLVDPFDARWYFWDASGAMTSFFYGLPGDQPIMGDWDCDGVDTPGMYRPSNGFVYLRNRNSTGVADLSFFFGLADDLPVAGDWDGDGCDTVGVFRPRQGRVYLSAVNATRLAHLHYDFGRPGDRPFAGDFDGDGDDEVGFYREQTGFAYLRHDHGSGPAERAFFYGNPGDQIVAGDWDADGITTVGAFRGADSRFYLAATNGPRSAAAVSAPLGLSRMVPVAGAHPLDCGAAAGACEAAVPYLEEGDSGAWVATLKERLAALGFRPGDGADYDRVLRGAVIAFQKHHGFARDGAFHPYQWDLLEVPVEVPERSDAPDRVEVDLGKQVLYLVVDGELAGVVPVSSGNGQLYTNYAGRTVAARTPEGEFAFYRQASGWYTSYLGKMYEPFFFRGGYAIHGSNSVPVYPASHGCIRTQNWDMDWLKPQLDFGMPVFVYGLRTPAPA